MADDIDDLLAKLRALPPMTKAERELQSIEFAYGNLACTTSHKPTLKAFWAVAASSMRL